MRNFIKTLIIAGIIFCAPSMFGAIQPNIVVSSSALEQIVKMITGPEASVISIVSANSCPHHYSAKLSDKQKIIDADYIILISPNFEKNLNKLAINVGKNKITYLEKAIYEYCNAHKLNAGDYWHFWLDLDLLQNILRLIKDDLSAKFPENRDHFNANFKSALSEIQALAIKKNMILKNLNQQIHLLDKDLLPFFTNIKVNYENLGAANKGLKSMKQLELTVKNNSNILFVTSNSFNPFAKHPLGENKLIIMNPEFSDKSNIPNSFIQNYIYEINKFKNL